MIDHSKIKNEIINSLKIKDEDIIQKVIYELDFLDNSEGLNDKNNLEDFYDRWQRNKHRIGKENKINSWTCYALRQTIKKPEEGSKFGVPRRAFTRPNPPDIDCDFDADRRNEIYEYATQKYGGPEYVANTATYQQLKFRAAVTRTIKALDLACAFSKGDKAYKSENMIKVNEILGSLPKSKGDAIIVRGPGGKVERLKTTLDVIKYFKDFAWYATEKYPKIAEYAPKIEGLYSSVGVHPAALVISNDPLREIVPLRRVKNGNLATQFVYEEIERMGLIKIDFLSLKTLTVIRECITLIKQNYGIDIDIEKLTWNDKKTFELYNSGKLFGVFQCESPGMQEKIMEIGIDKFDDIIAVLSLYRPGPMEYISSYANRKKGLEPITYPHPIIEKLLKPILDNTYGIIVYQEQIILACKALAGFSMTDGYALIKAVSKKKKDAIDRKKGKFVKGCMKNGVPEEIASSYWDHTILKFAEYGFNKGHALCYAANSYLTAYLKASYTEEYMCSMLCVGNMGRRYDKIEKFEKDLKKMNIKLLPKSINDCKTNYSIVKKADISKGIAYSEIRPALMVKNVGYEAAKDIEKNQPYNSLRDLAVKTSSIVDSGVVTGLYEAGFLDIFSKKSSTKKNKLTCEEITEMFANIRLDQKKSASKGVISENIFDNL